MKQLFMLIVALFMNALANVFVKLSTTKLLRDEGLVQFILNAVRNVYVWVGLVCFGIAFVLYTFSLTKFKLSIAYPIMTSAGFVIVSLFSHFLFKENLTLLKIIGMMVIAVGIWLVSL
ncbi:SMR family transporter [Pseudothermotoga sp.]|uniref:DMT family transporter n=1 Tax=Pseudothermotoga sp. TaxID=2033661 RepID=UPI0031F6B312